MKSFLAFLSFVTLLTAQSYAWKIVRNSTTAAPNYGSGGSSSSSSSDVVSDENFPLLWQMESVNDVDINYLNNNMDAMAKMAEKSFWKIKPANDNMDLYKNLLPKVVFLSTERWWDPSIPRERYALRSNGVYMLPDQTIRPPSPDNVMQVYNPNSLKTPIYVKADASKPLTTDVNNGKLRLIFHVIRVNV
ncbi:uncharacterized protein LOC130677557 [Microplitis mediator]|uniref:uncharacterized protein LOC130677557 n=1 Tax=Microplitis mediator TaxID=375433 RepID=UPI002552F5A4|nr:uncharacterized protein LOC130677557 [Microplitis mediator]